jgi:protease IV
MRWLKRVLVGFFAIVGFIVVALAALGVWIGTSAVKLGVKPVPDIAVLQLDLTKGLAQGSGDDPFAGLFQRDRLTLRQIEEALNRGARDSRVKGVVVRVGGTLGFATTQELRDTIADFRKAGKFALAFSESYGEGGGGNGAYYLATACEEIWLQPSGEVGLAGVVAETPFLKGTLDKLGVVPRFGKREEYKNAVDQLTDAAYSPAFRESMTSLLSSIYDQLTKGVSDGRGIPFDNVKILVDRGPFLASDALSAKLVDKLGYRDEADDAARRRAGTGSEPMGLRDYFRATRESNPSGRVMALVEGDGPIVSGESDFDDPLDGSNRIGADTMAKALDEAARSRTVAAIILRVDSPGGSYIASDTIWRAVERAKAAGKPVVVSMGNVAASGGYFISAPASKIVAEPGTLTGSIGVFGGKFVVTGLMEKLGITTDSVAFGANAGMWSSARDFTPAGWAKLQDSLDAIYKDFTGKVAKSRTLDASRIPSVAKGRVFTGDQALKNGLIDALGGLPTAIQLAREAANLKPDEPVRLVTYPPPGREFRRLLSELLSDDARVETRIVSSLAARLGAATEALRPLAVELPALLSPGDAWLLAPPIEVR